MSQPPDISARMLHSAYLSPCYFISIATRKAWEDTTHFILDDDTRVMTISHDGYT